MAKRTTIVGAGGGFRRKVAWFTRAGNGDVSAGLSDNGIVIAQPGGPIEGARNPHFTFHRPIYHHLQTNDSIELLAGLMEVELMMLGESTVPWVRLLSRPFEQLELFSQTRLGTEVLEYPIADPTASVEVALDFIHGGKT